MTENKKTPGDFRTKERPDVKQQEEECTPGIIRLGISNCSVIITGEGVIVVDPPIGNRAGAKAVEVIRGKTKLPVTHLIYTHGHMDHIWSVPVFLADAEKNGYPKPSDRYQRLQKQHEFINTIQFAVPAGEPVLPKIFYYPDITFSDSMQFRAGDLTLELYHYLGETDDALWIWVPERKIALVGDLLISGAPNVGNPFKVQRYTLEWAEALEAVAGKNPDYVIAAGEVLPKEHATEVLLDTAKYLHYIEDEVVKLLNEGCWIEEILERVKIPEELANKPWLAPMYGHPAFIIHGTHRRYAGWYNGNPSELFPAKSTEIAARIAGLLGEDKIMEDAKKLQQEGNVQLALHMIDLVIKSSEYKARKKEALQIKSELLTARADIEPSYIARNIFRAGSTLTKKEADTL